MKEFVFLFIMMSVQSTLQQYSYRQPFVGIPSEACIGDAINLTCETVFTNSGNLLSATITRNSTMVTGDTPNHTILTREGIVIGIIVSNVTLDDDDIEYTCTTSGAPDDFISSLILNVTGAPIIGMITVTEGCRYLYVSWMYNSNACGDVTYTVTLTSATMNMDITRSTTTNSLNITDSKLTYGTFNVTIEGNNTIGSGSNSTLASTPMLVEPAAPIMVETNFNFDVTAILISVSWQAPPVTTSCTANIIMYNITVMDQYSPAIVTVLTNMSSVEISFTDNGTSIVGNRKYNITVSAISELGPSNRSALDTGEISVLQNCDVTSPSIGTIRVSCSSPHQIQVTLTCNNCSNPMMIRNGNSPLTVTGLDPGIMYSVIINVFDGNQVVLSNSRVMENVTVIINNGGGGGDSGSGSNAGAIAGGVVGGVAGVTSVIISIVVVYICCCRDKDSTDGGDMQELKSPTSTSGSHTASVKPAGNVPHQTTASGEEYAVTTRVTTTKPQQQQPTQEYAVVDKGKKHAAATQGIHYADLQDLPGSGSQPPTNQGPTSTYAMVA